MGFSVVQLDADSAWIRPVFWVRLVGLEGELEDAVADGCSGGSEDVERQRVGDREFRADASALGAGPCGVEVDWVEALEGLDGVASLLGDWGRRAEESRILGCGGWY